ncbi:MAG: GNAT family N-acetyltransferase [Acidobacteria bacterium]|nr:GNAT family N-acetyltransferase [Acidobacteriota bacterium]
MIEVRPLGPDADDRYAAFLDHLAVRSPRVLAYHHPIYRDMLAGAGAGTPLYLGAFDGPDLVGALPGFVAESGHGACYCSLPYFGPNAGVLTDEGREGSAEVHRLLIGAVLRTMRERRAPLTAVFYAPFLFDCWELYRAPLGDVLEVDRQTQYLDLPSLGPFDAKLAYDIRKAERAGLSVTTDATDETLRLFYGVYEENCREHGIPRKPFAAIQTLVRRGAPGGLARTYFALQGNTLVGGLLVLWSAQVASYYVPCARADARPLQPGTLLIDRAIRDARAAGLRYWNWEASPPDRAGVGAFKQKWGSQASSYKIFVKRFCDESRLSAIGAAELGRSFPYFFVYPYDRLAA